MNNSNIGCVEKSSCGLMRDQLEAMKDALESCGIAAANFDHALFGQECFLSRPMKASESKFGSDSLLGEMELIVEKLLTLREVLAHIREAI